MERRDLVVGGGGLSSAKALEAYREADAAGSVLLLSADRYPPYHRPPLSKRLLRGEQEPEAAFVQPEAWYAEQQIELRLGTNVLSVDLGRRVLDASGQEVGFEQLLIATGAHPRTFDGALTLRTIDDSRAIRERARAAGRATVVGTGFIGLEVTASLRSTGVDVTLATGGRPLFERFRSTDFSAYLDGLYRAQGVELVDEAPAGSDPLVAGIGVVPTTDWLSASRVALDDVP